MLPAAELLKSCVFGTFRHEAKPNRIRLTRQRVELKNLAKIFSLGSFQGHQADSCNGHDAHQSYHCACHLDFFDHLAVFPLSLLLQQLSGSALYGHHDSLHRRCRFCNCDLASRESWSVPRVNAGFAFPCALSLLSGNNILHIACRYSPPPPKAAAVFCIAQDWCVYAELWLHATFPCQIPPSSAMFLIIFFI